MRLRTYGAEHIPREGGFVLSPNHISNFDPWPPGIALEAGVPLVPAAIAGTDNLRRLGPLRVAYGPPIELDDLQGREPRDAAGVATERLMAAIGELEKGL